MPATSAFWKPFKRRGWMNVNRQVCNVTINESADGQRLDNFLFKTLKNVPKSHVYQIIRNGEVRVNKKRAKAQSRLTIGDSVRIPPIFLSNSNFEQKQSAPLPKIHIPVLYEDDCLLVVDKPAGLAVHGGSGLNFGIIEILRQMRTDLPFLELAHRLDRDTSGVLILAKKRASLKHLHEIFKEKNLKKEYLTLVWGKFPQKNLSCLAPLLKTQMPDGQRFVKVDFQNGKPAQSLFKPIAIWENLSFLNAQIFTGRTHQIRVHLAHLGFPVLNDEKYGDFAYNKTLQKHGLKRMALHAHQITLPHPVDFSKKITLCAPLESSLLHFIQTQKKPLFEHFIFQKKFQSTVDFF